MRIFFSYSERHAYCWIIRVILWALVFYGLLMGIDNLLHAQSATHLFGNIPSCGTGSSQCSASEYDPAGGVTSATPIAVIFSGGSWSQINDVCPKGPVNQNICGPITALTTAGYVVYVIPYSTIPQGYIWPRMGQDTKCGVSTGAALGWPGNWQNVTLIGESAGGQLALMAGWAPKGKYLTDGNGACPQNSTNFTITRVVVQSVMGCLGKSFGAYVCSASSSAGQEILITELCGGDPTTVPAANTVCLDGSPVQYAANWAANGCQPYTVLATATGDTTVLSTVQAAIPVAATANGCTVPQIIVTGNQHGIDYVSIAFSLCNAFPCTLNNAIWYTGPSNCLNSSVPFCDYQGIVYRMTENAIYPFSSSGSSGSAASGGS